MKTQVARWGNSLAVRLPRSVVHGAHLQEGDKVDLQVEDNGTIVVVPARRWTRLERLVAAISPENRHDAAWGRELGTTPW